MFIYLFIVEIFLKFINFIKLVTPRVLQNSI